MVTFMLENKDYDQVLITINECIQRMRTNYAARLPAYAEQKNSLPDNPLFETFLLNKAAAFRSLFHESGDITLLDSVLHCHQRWSEIVMRDKALGAVKSEKYHDDPDIYAITKQAVKNCYQLYQATGDKKYIKEAYYFSDHGKSITLKENFLLKRILMDRSFPPTERKEVERLQQHLSKLQTLLSTSLSEQVTDSLQIERLWANAQLSQVMKKAIQKLPAAFHKLQSRREQLPDDQLLVDYVADDDSLYVLLIAKEYLNFMALPVRHLAEKVDTLRNAIFDNQPDLYASVAQQLYRDLFEPLHIAPATYPRIAIIPDGQIWDINFDVLLTSSAGGGDFKKMDFLLRKHSFSYAYTTGQVLGSWQDTERAPRSTYKVLGFALNERPVDQRESSLPFSDQTSRLNLPGSSSEVSSIATLMDGTFFYGRAASEKKFKEQASQYDILHLALHANANQDHPQRSKLYFSEHYNTSQPRDEDGYLHLFEISSLTLSTEMAVLSACQTGTGRYVDGTGMISLGMGFVHAGVNSLVLAQWKIPDMAPPLIMPLFYQYLNQGIPKDMALQQAKLRFLDQADNITSSPQFWGGFYLVGGSKPFVFPPAEKGHMAAWTTPTTFIMLAGLLVTAFLALYSSFKLTQPSKKP